MREWGDRNNAGLCVCLTRVSWSPWSTHFHRSGNFPEWPTLLLSVCWFCCENRHIDSDGQWGDDTLSTARLRPGKFPGNQWIKIIRGVGDTKTSVESQSESTPQGSAEMRGRWAAYLCIIALLMTAKKQGSARALFEIGDGREEEDEWYCHCIVSKKSDNTWNITRANYNKNV